MKVKLLAAVMISGLIIGTAGHAAPPATIVDSGGNLKMGAPAPAPGAGQNNPSSFAPPQMGAQPSGSANPQPTPYSASQPNAPYGETPGSTAGQAPAQTMPEGAPPAQSAQPAQPDSAMSSGVVGTVPSAAAPSGAPTGSGVPGPGETSLGVLPRPKVEFPPPVVPSKNEMPALPPVQGQ